MSSTTSKVYELTNRANKYARDVRDGVKPAGKYVRLACNRHLDDLKKQKDADFPYKFDRAKANRACSFIQRLPHVKGRWAQKKTLIKLEPWQLFAIGSLFGWVEKETGLRRYRDAFFLIPRKNGKSLLGAGIGLYMMVEDNEFGAEIYSGATSEKQALEVFKPARLMTMRKPALQEKYGVDVNAASLTIMEDGSKFEPLIGKPGDGASPSLAIVDEYHEHATPDLYDTMKTGMGAREQPLMLVITTAGSNIGGPCYDMQLDVQKILEGVFDDDRTFGLIYGIDEGDDWKSEASLRKANPNYDISVSKDYLIGQVQAAIRSPSKQNIVKTKHLNVWAGARTAWLNMELWNKCADKTLDIADFVDVPCVIGVDLASKIDIAALGQVFYREEDDGFLHYYAFPRMYVPEGALEISKNAQRYLGWQSQGLLEIIDGDEIDFGEIQRYIAGDENGGGLCDDYIVNEVVYDPWQATQLAQNLTSLGATAVEFRNTTQNMSPAMKELEGAIASGRFHHTGDPVLGWMASNIVVKPDANDNIFARKESSDHKIDGMIAMIMAVGRAFYAGPSGSAYEDQELLII